MNAFRNLGIGARLACGFAAMLLVACAIAAIGVWRLTMLAESTREMMQAPLAKERLISDWSRNINMTAVRTTAIAKSSDTSLATFFGPDAAAINNSSNELVKKIEALVSTPAEKDMLTSLVAIRKTYTTARDAVMKAKAAGQADEATAVFDSTFYPTQKKYQATIGQFVDMQRKSLDQHAQMLEQVAQTSRNWILALALLLTCFGVAFAVLITRGITQPIRTALSLTERVSAGDLTTTTVTATSGDETGKLLAALGAMTDSLTQLVSRVRGGAEGIFDATGQIAAGNQNLSQRTEEQASSLQETAASMEQLTGTVRQNAENARQADQLAHSATDVASKGGEVVGQVVQTMSSIEESSRKIVDIIAVIDGIAFQTNILALNAAVEAARAGEHGRGFAVVAAEVRTLAQRSATAAKEIKALIDDSVEKVGAGTELVGKAGQTMTEIVASIKRVTDIMGEIASASAEQTRGIEQVNQAVSRMDEVTQQNASLVEEAAASAQSMRTQADQLVQAVSVFKLNAAAALPQSGAREAGARPAIAARSGASPALAGPRTAPAAAKPARAARSGPAERPAPARVAAPVAKASEDWEEF